MFWIDGPFSTGEFSDVSIFCHSLKHMILCLERIEADKGYLGEYHNIDSPHECLSKKSASLWIYSKSGFEPDAR